jgi:hypothetical protein
MAILRTGVGMGTLARPSGVRQDRSMRVLDYAPETRTLEARDNRPARVSV